jgi:uncharacterized protein YjgD (DUF1641 family)
MARPIGAELPVRNPRAELRSRMETAPAEHAEAILAMFEVLQGLHDRGLLELMRGALGSGDKLLEIAVGAGDSPEAVRGLRNLLLLVKMLGEIDPGALRLFTETVPPALQAAARQSEPVGLWRLLMGFRKKDARRGLAAMQAALQTLGRNLAEDRPQ